MLRMRASNSSRGARGARYESLSRSEKSTLPRHFFALRFRPLAAGFLAAFGAAFFAALGAAFLRVGRLEGPAAARSFSRFKAYSNCTSSGATPTGERGVGHSVGHIGPIAALHQPHRLAGHRRSLEDLHRLLAGGCAAARFRLGQQFRACSNVMSSGEPPSGSERVSSPHFT